MAIYFGLFPWIYLPMGISLSAACIAQYGRSQQDLIWGVPKLSHSLRNMAGVKYGGSQYQLSYARDPGSDLGSAEVG
jgi:hypothetical protein